MQGGVDLDMLGSLGILNNEAAETVAKLTPVEFSEFCVDAVVDQKVRVAVQCCFFRSSAHRLPCHHC